MATNTKPLIEVADAAALVNSLSDQYFGGAHVADDLSNFADLGRTYDQLPSDTKEIVTSQLITLVTEQIFKAKQYTGIGPNIIRSYSSFDQSGGIVQVNRPVMPKAKSDKEAYDPTPNSSSDPFVNYEHEWVSTYFSKVVSWRYDQSRPEKWYSNMMLSADKLNAVVASLDTMVANAYSLDVQNLTLGLLRSSIAANLNGGGPRAINLLTEFNTTHGTTLTAVQATQDPEFMRWSIHRIITVRDDMLTYSKLFNEGKYPNFSTKDSLELVLISQFKNGIDQFLLSDTYNKELLDLPTTMTTPFWKDLGEGEDVPTFADRSLVNVKVQLPGVENPVTVNQSGVVAHLYDSDRIGLFNMGQKVTSQYDPVGLKRNVFTHVAGRDMLDTYANAVTFYIA